MSYFRCYLLNTADKIVSVDSLEARDDATAMEMAGQLILSKHTEFAAIEVWDCARRWWDYTAAYQRMIEATHTPEAPWYIVPADDKRRARLNLIRHLLDSIPYKKVKVDLPKIPKTQPRPKGLPRVWARAGRSSITIEDSRTVPIDSDRGARHTCGHRPKE